MTAKIKTIRSSWWEGYGYRLDCQPYLAGALETKIILEKLRHKKDRLRALTVGHEGGIYNGPQFVRRYVESPEYGIPFITGSSMQLADLSHLPLLSKKDACSPKLRFLELKQGMALISCSGTIGKMAYVRPEMEGMWSSQDVLKVVPDPNKIPPGYLYAFFSSKFGVPLIASGTYGAIIQHLEPEHIADIPIPRLDSKTEWEIHDLIEKAAQLRTNGNQELAAIKRRFNSLVNGVGKRQGRSWVNSIPSGSMPHRMDAGFYDPEAAALRRIIMEKRHTLISEFCSEILLPGIFKRVPANDPAYGVPYYTGNSLFEIESLPKGYLSRRTAIDEGVIIHHNMILVQAFGSEGGLNGRPVWVGYHLDGAATTHMLIRLKPKDPAMNGYLFAFLASDAGYIQMAALPYGGAIPHFDEKNIGGVVMPLMDESEMRSLSEEIQRIQKERDEALSLERSAREAVEEPIQRAG